MEHVISYSPEFDLKWQDILKLQSRPTPVGRVKSDAPILLPIYVHR